MQREKPSSSCATILQNTSQWPLVPLPIVAQALQSSMGRAVVLEVAPTVPLLLALWRSLNFPVSVFCSVRFCAGEQRRRVLQRDRHQLGGARRDGPQDQFPRRQDAHGGAPAAVPAVAGHQQDPQHQLAAWPSQRKCPATVYVYFFRWPSNVTSTVLVHK
jgi:hypothetical protein